MSGEITYEFELFVDDEWNAGGHAATLEDIKREAEHYERMYDQDPGFVRIEFYRVERITEDD